jgi:hypothetical protein
LYHYMGREAVRTNGRTLDIYSSSRSVAFHKTNNNTHRTDTNPDEYWYLLAVIGSLIVETYQFRILIESLVVTSSIILVEVYSVTFTNPKLQDYINEGGDVPPSSLSMT